MTIERLLDTLWGQYVSENRNVIDIRQLFENAGDRVVNDHIAFRTFNHPKVSLSVLARFFLDYGFEEKEEYFFESKHLYARYYQHNNPDYPKIFISELICEDFDKSLIDLVDRCVSQIPNDMLSSEQLLSSGCLWEPISYELYSQLLEVSEYAAWLYVFGYRANHFAVSVNHLNHFHSIQEVNDLLKNHHVLLNTSGGEVKGSPADCLVQSSTLSQVVEVKFEEGNYQVPCCYYEFAHRFNDASGELFHGFVTQSADKIFESTDFVS